MFKLGHCYNKKYNFRGLLNSGGHNIRTFLALKRNKPIQWRDYQQGQYIMETGFIQFGNFSLFINNEILVFYPS